MRSEENTSELLSRFDLVCRLIFNNKMTTQHTYYLSLHDAHPILKCKNRSGRTLFEKVNEDGVEISLIATERKDYLYLNEIIGNDRILYDKKVLLVGGGSLGSY